MTAHDPPSPVPINGAAPADARPHAPWPLWRKIVAYALLAALAILSTWYIDRKVHVPAHFGEQSTPALSR